ncbi:MAG TPA: leucine--tRNA ligase [Kiritimatiellia bacterium]|nr:leucine--tRNA ligase [Kiritimatiellia bacterium]
MAYPHSEIEKKWQQYWERNQTFRTPDDVDPARPKFYVLDMFPYPSGHGLHVGHPSGYTATDIVARYKRMKGFNVLHPMGYDSFGLPAQQYAVEHGIHPRVTTERNITNIERQIKMLGFSYDWARRIATTDPEYYRWTQWIFLQMFNSWFDPGARKARPIATLEEKLRAQGLAGEKLRRAVDGCRLAYMAEVPVNWCPALGTVLANEEVTNEGRSDRGNHPVYRRALKQWMLRITAYADRLVEDLKLVDWPDSIKLMQRNWIGKSEGAEVLFQVAGADSAIRVYTTRPDTLYGATYMVLAPEHPLVGQITTPERRAEVAAYVNAAARKSEVERMTEGKEKTGVFSGALAVNPVNGQKIPVWVADYVMMGYGTGAIMAVPAHDTRDFEFAQKFGLPVVQVVQPPAGEDWRGFVGDGIAVNSGAYDGLPTAEFKKRITADLEAKGLGRYAVNYKLRDWIFSRQWYWGEPFPIVHCSSCGPVGLPEDQLPLRLPELDDFTPETTSDPDAPPRPPLGRVKAWADTTCPACGGPATRELNAMPQWAGSCWYYLRFLDPRNASRFVDPEREKYWMSPHGVDLYVGGAEHAVLHLLYARFWHKVLHDLGHVSGPEPFGRLFNQGMIRSFAYRDRRGVCISYDKVDLSGDRPRHVDTGEELAESVEKMSKSLKNVVTPDGIVQEYGADSLRLYEMFIGPLEGSKPWNTRDVPGVHRFLNRVWRMVLGDEEGALPLLAEQAPEEIERELHRLIKRTGEYIESMKFNTAVAAMMEFVNAVYRVGAVRRDQAERFVLVLAPFAPHLAEELWNRLGHPDSLAREPWPAWSAEHLQEETLEIPVQVNGRVRGRIHVPVAAGEEDVLAAALACPEAAPFLAGKTVRKRIYIPGRMVNLVVAG